MLHFCNLDTKYFKKAQSFSHVCFWRVFNHFVFHVRILIRIRVIRMRSNPMSPLIRPDFGFPKSIPGDTHTKKLMLEEKISAPLFIHYWSVSLGCSFFINLVVILLNCRWNLFVTKLFFWKKITQNSRILKYNSNFVLW